MNGTESVPAPSPVSSPQDAAAGRPARTVTLSFYDLRAKVSSGKEILKGITGTCHPSRVLCIMGSSGAGKTTLLDILAANRLSGVEVSGQVLVNGKRRNDAVFRRASCYVLQRDVLPPTSSVREALMSSALLKLPRTMKYKEKVARVEAVLRELGLDTCQNVLVGDELLGIKGISGGQRRRVSIGIELVKDPRMVLLDEPTSGLDSEMAYSLFCSLVDLSKLGRTVCLTIHQPNSLITSRFDDFMLLAEGELVYSGAFQEAVGAFAAVGLHCPHYTNPTDYFLNVLQYPENIGILVEQQKKSMEIVRRLESEADIESGEVSSLRPEKATKAFWRNKSSTELADYPEAPWWYQAKILASRSIKQYIRNPAAMFSETAQYLFMGAFIAVMYLQVNNSVETGVQDRLASVWFGLAVLSFTPSFTAVTIWDRERILLRREVGQGMYSVAAYFGAKTIVNVPVQLLQVLFFAIIAFFGVGYAITASNFFIYFAAYAFFQITAESIGVMCAAVTKTSTMAVLVLTFVLLILLSFSGFLVSSVPVYFKWVAKISFLTYAYNAVLLSEFGETTFVCETGPPACPEAGATYPGLELLPSNISQSLSAEVNLVILICIAIATRILAFLSIWLTYKLNFL